MRVLAWVQGGALSLARTGLGGIVLQAWLRTAPGTFPVRVLHRNRSLLVAVHPAPAYPHHLLLIPLPPLPGLEALDSAHAGLLAGVVNAGNQLAAQLDPDGEWQLVVNGGAYQDVRMLHFHLILVNPGSPNRS